ncbi:MAG: ATP-binding protein [Phycisphaerae bacterium]|jgi:signal transduction histidine kinase|nr:ATP-binding protein [Phycisphaerae bacterium]
MSQEKTVVLMFEDDLIRRVQLQRELQTEDIEIVTPGTWLDTYREIRDHPEKYDVVFLDRIFSDMSLSNVLERPEGVGNVTSGDDLAREIAKINPMLPITIYTTRELPGVGSQTQARAPWPVVYRDKLPDLLDVLRTDLEELRLLSLKLQEMQEGRRGTKHLLANLGVGFQVSDIQGRVWYCDEVFRRVIGESGSPYNFCYCKFHGYSLDHGRCKNCLTNCFLNTLQRGDDREDAPSRGIDGVFYCPTYPNGPGSDPVFQYLHVHSDPLWNTPRIESGEEDPSDAKRRLLAVIETVSQIKPGSELDAMGLTGHLDLLVAALENMGVPSVGVFRAHEVWQGKSFKKSVQGLVARGIEPLQNNFSDIAIPLRHAPKLLISESGQMVKVFKLRNLLDFNLNLKHKLGIPTDHDPICAALFDGQARFLGVVLLGNWGAPLDSNRKLPPLQIEDLSPARQDTHQPPSPMAVLNEIARIMAAKPLAEPLTTERLSMLERVRLNVAARVSSGDVDPLIVVMEEVQTADPGLEVIHVRELKGNMAVSLAYLGGDLRRVSPRAIDIRKSERLTSRVAMTGLPDFLNDVVKWSHGAGIPAYGEMSQIEKNSLRSLPSYGIYPLLTEGAVIGTVSFRSATGGFFDQEKKYFLELMAGLLAQGLKDHISREHESAHTKAEAARARAMEIQAIAASLVLHNTNQPLRAITADIANMRRCLKSPKASRRRLEELLGRIDEQRKRISEINRDFLLFTRPGSDEPQRENIHSLIRRICREQQAGYETPCKIAMDGELEIVWTYPRILEVVLSVLLKNAYDVLADVPSGNRYLNVCLRRRDETSELEWKWPEDTLVIDVVDSGPGVDQETLTHLFEPSNSNKVQGLGIGLAYARSMTRVRSGDVILARSDHRGACFTVYLPFSDAAGATT